MSHSPYRRGIPVLFVGGAVLVIACVAMAWGARAAGKPSGALAGQGDSALTTFVAPPASASELTPSPSERRVPVETSPPGAKVYDVTNKDAQLLCPSTPCMFTGRQSDMIV